MTIDELLTMIKKKETRAQETSEQYKRNGNEKNEEMFAGRQAAFAEAHQLINANRAQIEASMRPKLRYKVYSSKGRSTGWHEGSLCDFYGSRYRSVEEAKQKTEAEIIEMGFEPEFIEEN